MKHMVRRLVCLATVAGLSFGAMADLPVLPMGYARLASLTSTGAQRIDLKEIPDATVSVKMNFNTGTYVNQKAFFGQAWNGSQYLFNEQSNNYMFHGGSTTIGAVIANHDASLEITTDPTDNLTLAIGEIAYTNSVSLASAANATMYLFGCSDKNRSATFTLYDFTMWRNGALAHQWVPAKNLSTGKLGIVDLANPMSANAFLPNIDSGADFTPGAYVDSISVSPIPAQLHTGSEIRPTPSVAFVHEGVPTELPPSAYKLSYANNVNQGTGTVTITGTGEYGFSVSVPFSIIKPLLVTAEGMGKKDGSSWADAMTWTNALQYAVTSDVPCEIWMAGNVALEAGASYSFTKCPVTIRGGFVGTETRAGERAVGRQAEISGGGAYVGLQFSNTDAVLVDGLAFTNCRTYGLCKTGGAGDLTVSNCAFRACGNMGASFTGTSAATLRLVDCLVDRCQYKSAVQSSDKLAQGVMISTFNRAYVDGCTFTHNGISGRRIRPLGSMLYATGAPLTMRNCRFAGNWNQADQDNPQAACKVISTAGACAITNCVFTGWYANTAESDKPPALYVSLASADATFDVVNCTFAYNVLSYTGSSAAIGLNKGTMNVLNSIFFGNLTPAASAYPSDIWVASGATAHVRHCLFSEDSANCYKADAGGTLDVVRETCVYDDPLFVTSADDFKRIFKCTAIVKGSFTWPGVDAAAELDVHLRSSEGYATNGIPEGAAWPKAAGVLSPAIDAGDPSMPVGEERPPMHGGIINLGAYGGTKWASLTPSAHVEVTDPVIDFPSEYTQPRVSFALGGEGVYLAQVELLVSTDGGTTWQTGWGSVANATNGQQCALLLPFYCRTDSTIIAKLSITAKCEPSPVVAMSEETPAEGTLPPWYGKGGAHAIHVRPGATGRGDGTSWTDACTDIYAAMRLLTAERGELWIAGTNLQTETPAITVSMGEGTVVRGGFNGWEDTPEERPAGQRSVVNGQGAYMGLAFTNPNGVIVEHLDFTNCTTCLAKSGAGSVTVTNCLFHHSSNGASFTGAAGATLRVINSEFYEMHGSETWRGLYAKSFDRAEVEDCYFHHIGKTTNSRGYIGPTVRCESTPVTMRRCRFSACWVHGDQSTPEGLVRVTDAADACRFENCVWTGCLVDTFNRTPSDMSTLYLSLKTQETPCEVVNCTFAYNKVGGYTAYPGGLHVVKGAVDVRNTIFYGNTVPANNTRPTSLFVESGASCRVTYSLFEADSTDHFGAVAGGTLDVDRKTCVFGDPLFVTPRATAVAGVGTMDLGNGFDVHLRSSEGYATNGIPDEAEWPKAEGVLSPAIDTGSEADSFANEPRPNGGRINMGAYGNTSEASRSPTFELALAGPPTVEFLTEYTQPTVTFTTGGEGVYSARAVVSVSTNGTDWIYESAPLTAVTNGDTRVVLIPEYYQPGGSIWVRVTLECKDQRVEPTPEETPVEGRLPPWYGKGGGANVIHVREGAVGKRDGTSWTDAYDNIYEAICRLDGTRNELWVAGTNVYFVTGGTPSFPSATFRGGFEGCENSPDERRPGVASALDGNGLAGFEYSSTGDVLFERIDFVRCTTCLSQKSGKGGLTVTNCHFRSSGGGLNVTGGSAGDLVVRDCTFVGIDGSATARGVASTSFRRTFVEDCVFERLGASQCYRGTIGPALYAASTPVTVRRCRFAGCWSFGNQSTPDGAAVVLTGAGGESAFTNCVFAGSYGYDTENRGQSVCKALIRVALAQTNAVCRFDRCTFAYNRCGNKGWSGGLYVAKGDVRIRNSIFFGNTVHAETTLPSDIYVLKDAACRVAYTSFDGTNEAHCAAADGGLLEIDAATCPLFDPQFVTDAATGAADIGSNAKCGAFNVHLRGGSGYVDETTGETVKTWAKRRYGNSPAIDAGDPAVLCVEPAPNGRRINLGAYGNTPWATMSKGGTLIFVR